ncbi:MAG: glycosyl transferase [Thermoleophilia bacterium]|nr:glycosyl transferase [Thermoleophilia bacterium]
MSRTIRQRKLRQRRNARRRAQLTFFAVIALLLTVAGGAWGTYDYLKGADESWPTIENMRPQRIGENSIVYSRDGKPMGYIKSDQNRKNLPFTKMGEWAPRATVAIEDQRFYQHNGVDPEGMMRALSVNLEAGSSEEGASTVTQQVVRNLYKEITVEKTLSRKAKEATLAIQLEERWSKKKILETYLNLVFYGNNAYGIEAASLTYFNKSAKDLTIPEAALLAGLPQQPSRFDPYQEGNVPKATARRNDVLAAMFAQDMITKAEYDAALATPIKLSPTRVFKERKLPYVFDYVEQELIQQFGAATVRQGGLTIKTTIDPKLQKIAERAVKSNLPAGGPSGAIAVLDTKTGEIRAMASTSSYADSKFNRAAQARRQPGSTAKIWVLASFLREGVDPDANSYTSRPIKVRYGPGSEYWEPKTYSGSFAGTMSIRRATTASDNSVYAQMTLDISPEKVAETAHKLGIKSPLETVWSIGLGSQVVTPLEQTNFYSSIARGGIRRDPRAIESATTPGGTELPLKYPKSFRVLEDWQADTIRSILRDNVTGGTGVTASSIEDAAGKTGTTDDAKDAWFCGMTPELTACVWMGYNIPTPMGGVAGGGTPTTIWRDFMRDALPKVPDQEWFKVKGTPTWVPWVSRWQTGLGLDVAVGSVSNNYYQPSYSGGNDDNDDAAPADDTAGTGTDAGTGTGTGATPEPTTPGPTSPEPTTPGPTNPEPTNPAPAPVARR